MRTKAHRYSTTVPSATFTSITECIGLTGDFDGGSVQANFLVFTAPGVGNWISGQLMVDGVAQGVVAPRAYQSGANVALAYAATLRVPSGRHRISVQFGTNVTPIASSTAELSVAELNA